MLHSTKAYLLCIDPLPLRKCITYTAYNEMISEPLEDTFTNHSLTDYFCPFRYVFSFTLLLGPENLFLLL